MKKLLKVNCHKLFKYIFLPLIIYALLKNRIDTLISEILVKHLFGYIYPSKWIYDAVCLILILYTGYLFNNKISKKAKIPEPWIYISVVYCCIYFFYRINENSFELTSLELYPILKLLDIVPIFLLVCIVIIVVHNKWLRKKKGNTTDSEKQKVINNNLPFGFHVDLPCRLDSQTDQSNRYKFAHYLIKKLAATNASETSFALGIVAPWGAGKTVLLKAMKEIAKTNNFIEIELNLWKNGNADQIIESFFKQLNEKLKPYSFSLENNLNEYAKNLIAETKSNFLVQVSEVFFKPRNLNKQFETIRKEIIHIKKKILVLVDDLDRLDKKEIYEVVRLIRDTANFPYIYFIVAYDRNYVLNALQEINAYQPHFFLDKIFQSEFTLPPLSHIFLEERLNEELAKILSKNDRICFEEFLNANNRVDYGYNGIPNITKRYINNIRDVLRFVNNFSIRYEFVSEEIYFPDFYNLELIRLKHPEIVAEFFKNYNTFLTNHDEDDSNTNYGLMKNDKKEILLESHLKSQKEIFKISDIEVSDIINSFNLIFKDKPSGEFSSDKLTNFHLTIVKPSNFNRYFIFDIEKGLSEIAFSNARQQTQSDFNNAISKWVDIGMENQVKERFKSIENYDSIEDAKKIIRGIFYLGALKTDERSSYPSGIIGYNINDIYNKILKISHQMPGFLNQKKTANQNELYECLYELFEQAISPYSFESELIQLAIKLPLNDFPIEKQELFKINLKYLSKYCDEIIKLNPTVWQLYKNCELTEWKSNNIDHVQTRSISITKEANTIIEKFILEKDLDTFIKLCIYRDGSNMFRVYDDAMNIFGGKRRFKDKILNIDGTQWQYLDEFKSFLKELESRSFSPIDFSFKIIPINTLNESGVFPPR